MPRRRSRVRCGRPVRDVRRPNLGDQEDAVESVTIRSLDPLASLIGDEVGGNQAGTAGVLEIAGEPFDAVMVDQVPVAHDEWHAAGVGHRLDRLEHAVDAFPVIQGDLAGRLNDGAVHHRVGVRQADLDRVDAVLDHDPERVE